ncbi:MAG: hypothetical protein HY327_13240 [Chloroflexi bacterium]|nr:hypothetical protein [Chloroflexota bacterium]
MNRIIFFILPFLAACAAVPTEATPIQPTGAPTGADVAVIAHRGGAGLAPENTLASFKNGLALDVDVLEMDTHLTKDGIVVVFHDATIERTTDGKGRVADFTLAELQKFNAAAQYAGGTTEKQSVPTFAQVLDLAKPTRARIEVEIKVPVPGRYAGIEQKLLDEIAARAMLERVQVSSFDFGVLKDLKTLNPRVTTVALLSLDYFRAVDINQPARVIDQIRALDAAFIAVNKDLLTPALVQEAQKRGIQVEVWTVDREEEMKKFAEMKVDGIISNRPDILKRVLGK